MSDSIETQGVEFRRGDGATPTEAFTLIAEIVSFNGPDGQASEIDVTHLNSVAKEFRLGLKDSGQISFECNLVPDDTEQVGLRSDMDSRTLRNFEIELTDGTTTGTTLSFAAFVKQFSIAGAVDEVMKASVTLRISGDVTWTPAT